MWLGCAWSSSLGNCPTADVVDNSRLAAWGRVAARMLLETNEEALARANVVRPWASARPECALIPMRAKAETCIPE